MVFSYIVKYYNSGKSLNYSKICWNKRVEPKLEIIGLLFLYYDKLRYLL